jgi:glycosyltransferase involved in cell wall biosynthesis
MIPQNPTNVFVARGYHLAKHLAELGDEVHFVIWDRYPTDISNIKKNLSSSLKYVEYIKDGVVIHKIRRLPFFFPLINAYMFRKLVSQICKRESLDAIIASSFINEVVPPFDLPLIYDLWDHSESNLEYAGSVARFGLNYILNLKKSVHAQIKNAAAVTAVSDILVAYAKKINPNIPVYKIVNGVDSLFLEATLKKPKNKAGRHSMVYAGYFAKWSNLPKLLEATRLLKGSYPDIELVLAGNGPLFSVAKELVGSLGLSDHVTFLGHVPREKLPGIINSCEIALSPLTKDLHTDCAFPIKIMEYTALGKKIVSSNLEEVKLLGFPNIVLYDENNGVHELVNGIITAFNMDIDQYETRRLAFKYTWKEIAQQFHHVIQKVIANKIPS